MTNTIPTTDLRTLAADIITRAQRAGASDAEVTIRDGDEFSKPSPSASACRRSSWTK